LIAGAIPLVLVASDSPITRAGIAALVDQDERMTKVGACAIADAPGEVLRLGPDVIAIDVTGHEEPASVVAGLTSEFRSLSVVVLADHTRRPVVVESLRRGAKAWLLSSASPEALQAAVLAGAVGLTVLDDRATSAMLSVPSGDPGPSYTGEQLTSRELEVLRLLGRGYPSKTVARELGISEHTAKFHVSSILGKLGASSRTEAVTRAIRLGLIAV
jgi:DNA-binding NarL/FixJ family response regulator